jgi:V/A-type H+/Na+-transporting ATPase subunit I
MLFYPQAMTEVELIVPEKDLLSVTKLLSGRGIFHQADGNYLSTEKETSSPNLWSERVAGYSGLERRIQVALQSLGLDEGPVPNTEFKNIADLESVRPVVEKIEQAIKKTTEQMAAEHKRLEQLDANVKQLEPVTDIDLDISSIRSPHYLYSLLGTMPVENMDRLQTSLERIPHVFLPLRQESKKAIVWLGGDRSNSETLNRAARSAFLIPLALPDSYQGTPAQILETLRKETAESQKTVEELKAMIGRLGKTYEKQLQELYWEVHASHRMSDAIVRFGKLRYTYLVLGWVITDNMEDLTRRLRAISPETLIDTRPVKRSGGTQNVPSALSSSKWLAPFQMMVNSYGRPRYNELDPTLLMMVTFPLFFGAMFGDIGHGLLFGLLGWLMASKKVKAFRGFATLGGLMMACGGMAIVFGVLYGSIFGNEEILPALWMSPMHNIMSILYVAIGFGAVIISLGFILGIFNAYRRGDWARAFIEPKGLSGLILYWSMLGLALSLLVPSMMPIPPAIFGVLAALSGLVVMFYEIIIRLIEGHRPLVPEGIGTYGIQAFFELFEAFISMLSNSLSFVRVGAFAVAHGFLSAEVIMLAGEHFSFGWVLAYVIGTIFIVGFEGLIVSIQTMRLNYYEFFSKFFTGGGVSYEPLSLRPGSNN